MKLETIVKPEEIKAEPVAETSLNIVPSKKKKKKSKASNVATVNGSQAQQNKTPTFKADKKAKNNHQKVPFVKTPLAPKSNKRKFPDEGSTTNTSGHQNQKKMKFNQNGNFKKTNKDSNELSENRLKAFGINPKKFKNKLKYNNKNQQAGNHKKPFQKKKTS